VTQGIGNLEKPVSGSINIIYIQIKNVSKIFDIIIRFYDKAIGRPVRTKNHGTRTWNEFWISVIKNIVG
jgi:hypothetical protein